MFKNYLEKPFPAVSFVGVYDLDNGAMIAVEGQGINTLRHEQAHKTQVVLMAAQAVMEAAGKY